VAWKPFVSRSALSFFLQIRTSGRRLNSSAARTPYGKLTREDCNFTIDKQPHSDTIAATSAAILGMQQAKFSYL
jgi:hypothetical protein